MSLRLNLGPRPRLGYAGGVLERAAERRADLAGLAAIEDNPATRTYVFAGDVVVLQNTPLGLSPLLIPAAARKLGSVAEAVFLGLRDGDACFALALKPTSVDALKNH